MQNRLTSTTQRTPLDLSALRATARKAREIAKLSTNPMPRTAAKALPKSNRRGDLRLAPRCQARCKHDHRPCRQPAMRGRRVCRMHGGKAGAPKGARNGAWRNGFRSNETRAMFRAFSRTLADMDAVLAMARDLARAKRAERRQARAMKRSAAARPAGGS